MKLAVFVDQVFWRDGTDLYTDEAYALFLASLAGAVDRIVLIGREAPQPGRAPYRLDPALFTLCPLPYYAGFSRLWRQGPRIWQRLRQMVEAQSPEWDALLISGPNPIGQVIARMCVRRGVPIVSVVRQNLVRQMGTNAGGKRWLAVPAAVLLERDFRRLARGRTVLAVGGEMTAIYRRHGARVHAHFVCLVTRAQFEAFAHRPAAADPRRLICVGRLVPEKGHADLLAALARLKRQNLACHADIVGVGPLEADLRALAARLGVADAVTFHGYVPYGEPLFERYRRAGALVVPSLSEGFPQVVNEALSLGLPVVATAVGGIPDFLTDGETALLVPPRDVAALADAIARLVREPGLRARVSRRGQALMADNTLEANRARVLAAVREAVDLHAGPDRPSTGVAPARRARAADPARPMPAQPRVSLIVPLRNEMATLDALVADILAQDYPAIAEVWLVDGGSADGTREALQRLVHRDGRLRLLDNPAHGTAAGLNRALALATGEVVMRLDAHASYDAGLVRLCVAALLRTGAGGVGPVARPAPARTLVGRAIVAAHRSPFGIGVAKFRRDGAEGWATTIWNGCYWRFVLDEAGPMREDLARAEDNDFNQRVRALGYGLWVAPDARAFYRPRGTLGALARQYFGNGLGVARTLFENPRAVSPRHLAPLALVVVAAAAGAGLVSTDARPVAASCALAYGALLVLATLLAARGARGWHLLALPVTLATLHASYGIGTLAGLGRRLMGLARPRHRPRPVADGRA